LFFNDLESQINKDLEKLQFIEGKPNLSLSKETKAKRNPKKVQLI